LILANDGKSSNIELIKSPPAKYLLSILNWGLSVRPFWIINDPDYYINPMGLRVSNTPSITWNNDSPLTVSNTGGTAIFRGDLVDARFTLNSDYSSNYGIFTSRQVNSVLKQSLGISLPTFMDPQELTIRSSVRATISMPSDDKLTVTSTINTQVRNNPHGVVGAIVVASWEFLPMLATGGRYVAIQRFVGAGAK
jgi:hypothetical protein